MKIQSETDFEVLIGFLLYHLEKSSEHLFLQRRAPQFEKVRMKYSFYRKGKQCNKIFCCVFIISIQLFSTFFFIIIEFRHHRYKILPIIISDSGPNLHKMRLIILNLVFNSLSFAIWMKVSFILIKIKGSICKFRLKYI